MANVKVPALLHKMSKAAQRAWYKKNNMTMPSEVEGGGRSAAAAKRVVAPAPRKQMAAAPQSVRAMNTARQQAYYAKGGRQPIGAGGSGGSSSMAGVGQSSAKEIIKGIKAGYNPKVALVRYTNEEAKQMDEGAKEDAEKLLGGPVKTKPKMPPGKQPEGYRYVRALARRAMKAGLKKEEVEQVDEVNRNKTKTNDYGGRYLDSINRDKEIKELERKISKMSPNDGGGRYLAGLKLDKMKAGLKKEEAEQVRKIANEQYEFIDKQHRYTDYKKWARHAQKIGYRLKDRVVQERGHRARHTSAFQDKQDMHGEPMTTWMGHWHAHIGRGWLTTTSDKQRKAIGDKTRLENKKKIGEEAEQVDEAGYQVIGTTKDKETFRSKVHPKKAEALSTHYKMAKSRKYKDIKLVKVQEEVEQVDEARRMSAAEKLGRAFDSEQQRSALSRQRGLDLLKQKDTEKMQNKLASGNMTKLKKEETEESTMKYIEEKLTAADPASKWISDFVKSDNPKFAGKSKKERIQQALGAYYAKKRGTNEEVEQVDEGRLRRSMRGYAVLGGYGYGNKVRNQSAGERSREINVGLDDKQEKENARRAAEADKAKMKKEEVEQVDEAKKPTVGSDESHQQRSLHAYAKEFDTIADKHREDAAKATNKNMLNHANISAKRAKEAAAMLRSGKSKVHALKHYQGTLQKEEAKQMDELKASTLGSYIAKSSADEKSRREKGVAVSKELSAKTGMKFGTPFDPKIHSKNASRSANRAVAIKKLTGQAKVNANEAAEGKVAVTPKEKSLAAHHGDKTKITFGDVLKARLKSAAAKKMGK